MTCRAAAAAAEVSAPEPAREPWRFLEGLPGQRALWGIWEAMLGERFEGFRSAFLQPCARPAGFVPCPRGCGCWHEVVAHGAEDIVGVCRCDSWRCDDISLAAEELVVWELNWERLGRALCRVLELESKPVKLGLPGTRQIGSWSAQAIPVLLTIQAKAGEFRRVVGELASRLQKPFILLAPTARHIDVPGEELLARIGARFFPLEAHVRVVDGVRLWAPVASGKLFAGLVSEPEREPEEDAARGAFAMVRALDAKRRFAAPSLVTVFRLYCADGLSAGEIGARCGISKTSVMRRLEAIRACTGARPEQLRRLSPYMGRMEEAVSDSRARRLRRREFIEEGGEERDES